MKRACLPALLLTLLTGCAAPSLPLHIAPARLNPQPASIQHLSTRSDEGLRKGVIELRKVRFKKWDKNHSGDLTRDEVKDEQMLIPGVIEGFHSYDTNGNGKIVWEEFLREDVIQFWMQRLRPELEKQFAKHDKDGNWLLTANEQKKLKLFFSLWPHLHGGDLNQDGVILFTEYEDAYMEVLPFFQQGQAESEALPPS